MLQQNLINIIVHNELDDTAILRGQYTAHVLQGFSTYLVIFVFNQLQHLEEDNLIGVDMIDACAGIDVPFDFGYFFQGFANVQYLCLVHWVLLLAEELQKLTETVYDVFHFYLAQ